ncbi:unnamed protein product [Mytilus coruscus]|uniref:Uncharacterized protein n=1 Tax=Mytilus coruscus TaxID=42192 RepID=A0A6J7ZUZ4_MYTCO|nr:unnamed protein product [Mytilus coruscus]
MNAEELLSENIVENINIDDDKQEKKNARLSSVVAGGNSKQYLGKKLQLSDIDKMTPEQIDKLYCKYEARLGAKKKHKQIGIKRRIQRLDFINEQLQKEHHAEHTFEDVDQAMKQYYYITSKQLTPLSPKPKLSDFYTPSEDQKIEKLHLLLVEWF